MEGKKNQEQPISLSDLFEIENSDTIYSIKEFIDRVKKKQIDPKRFIGEKASIDLDDLGACTDHQYRKDIRFTEVVTNESVASDAESVITYLKKFDEEANLHRNINKFSVEKRNRFIGSIVESLFIYLLSSANWLSGVTCFYSSKFDDIHNKVDGFVQFGEAKNFKEVVGMGLSVDYTLSLDGAREKFTHIIKGIIDKKPTLIKYFVAMITRVPEGDTDADTFNDCQLYHQVPKIVLPIFEDKIDLVPEERQKIGLIEDINTSVFDKNTDAKKFNDIRLKYFFIRETYNQLNFFLKLTNRLVLEKGDKFYVVANEMYKNAFGSFHSMLNDQFIGKEGI